MNDIDQAKGQIRSDSQSTIAKMWTELVAVVVSAVAVGGFYWKVIEPVRRQELELLKIDAQIAKKVGDERLRELSQQRDALLRQIQALPPGPTTTSVSKALVDAAGTDCRFDGYVVLDGGSNRARKDLLGDELAFMDAQCAVAGRSFRTAKYSVTCSGCE